MSSIIDDASAAAKRKEPKGASGPFGWLTKLFQKKSAKKDYTYEFDPRTGGRRRVYVVRDARAHVGPASNAPRWR